MGLRFVKMQGTGNDFVILDESAGPVKDAPALAQTLCRRHYGVGADGLVVVTPGAAGAGAVRFYNPDGGEAELCGNGLRCAAHYLRWRRGAPGELTLTTAVGARSCLVNGKPWQRSVEVCVDMGEIGRRGVAAGGEWLARPLEVSGITTTSYALAVGNPHLMLLRAPEAGEVVTEGPELSRHPAFVSGVNVGWATQLGQDRLRVATYERGVGKTLACGTNACAAVAAFVLEGRIELGATVEVELGGGVVRVGVDESWRAWLEGPSEVVFEGDLAAAE